jgi:hypothetical protein
MRFRWAFAGGLALLALLFLTMQLLVGFSLHHRIQEASDREFERARRTTDNLPVERRAAHEKRMAMLDGMTRDAQRRTMWLGNAFFFHCLAVACAGLVLWNDLRRPKPSPRIDLVW